MNGNSELAKQLWKQHLDMIARMFEVAANAGFLFKLDKVENTQCV